jgi:hypothetical protein
MASLILSGSTSGSVTLSSPAVSGTTTLTLPTTTGTVVVTSGAQTIEFADGSAGAPSITNSGNTNTGMFFPAADTIAFAEGGAESMRIDSSGNVGIGTTSPGVSLQVNGGIRARGGVPGANGVNNNGYAFSGNGGDTDGGMFSSADGRIEFYTNNVERMRITSGGEVYIADTTDRGAFNLQCNGTGVWGAGAYTNGSDERIKENITPLNTGLDVVAKLNPVTYTYKEDWSRDQSIQTGFIAQDLLVALEGKNYVDGIVNQSSEYMSVAYQNIIPILTKAIQEQQTIINDIKTELDNVKTELATLKGAPQ